MKNAVSRCLALPVVLLAVMTVACDEMQLVAPLESTITVSASATSLPRGGTAEVVAIVIEEAGTPVQNGTIVRFSATNGRVEPADVQTREGVARATFIAGTSPGTARITATSGGATSGDQSVVEIAIFNSATAALSVTPASPTVGQTVRLTVTPTIATGGQTPRAVVAWGDGSSTDLGPISGAREATHVYASAATYTIATTLIAEDAFTTSTTVTIGPAGPVTVNVSASSSNPPRCQPVTFTASAALQAGDSAVIARYDWSINSNTDSEDAEISTTGNILARVFNTSGTKTVTVTAVATDGRQGSGQTQIVVRELTGAEVCS